MFIFGDESDMNENFEKMIINSQMSPAFRLGLLELFSMFFGIFDYTA